MRDTELGAAAYLRFVLSGAICSSGVHLAVTPIDVVKTKVQADPVKYPGIIKSFRRVLDEEGLEGLTQGWLPTFIGFFTWGGLSYALTEYLRRVGTATLGDSAANYEVAIILAAAGTAAAVGSFVLCPFESLRIRLVSQKDYASNAIGVLTRMTKEEGIMTFFKAVPLFFAKEIPFAMAKFTVFDQTTNFLYNVLPAAKEDIQLSLLVSLCGGILGGVSAAVVSNPADITITTLKKSKSDIGIGGAIELVLSQGGLTALFRGLPLRIIFYALVVSLQFLVYDSIRLLLGVGSDDLKLYLDVLGGALSESDGPL
jgi:solute carrier family 25 (mitochondrial phosphate transporter), member 3